MRCSLALCGIQLSPPSYVVTPHCSTFSRSSARHRRRDRYECLGRAWPVARVLARRRRRRLSHTFVGGVRQFCAPDGPTSSFRAGSRARTAKPSGLVRLVRALLLRDVLADNCNGCTAAATGEVGRRPQCAAPQLLADVRVVFFPNHAAGNAFQAVHQVGNGNLRWVIHQKVHVVILAVELDRHIIAQRRRNPRPFGRGGWQCCVQSTRDRGLSD